MDICFVGVGSIGLRHIKNLRELYGSQINITALRSGNGRKLTRDEEVLIDRTIHRFDDMTRYDIIFITNPTSVHYETLNKVIENADAFFIEKPVFMTGYEDCECFNREGKVFYVACPLRYCNVIRYVKDQIDFSTVYSVRSICSSYLPDWRPGSDYVTSYSASKEKGGGVSIDLIHEWDYLTYLLGTPKEVKSIITKKSDLEIDSDDIAIYIAEFEKCLVELHLDYFGRKHIRNLELFTQNDTILCDLIEQKILFTCSGTELDLSQQRDDYQKQELEHFMEIIKGNICSDNDLKYACRTLRLAEGCI